MNIRKIVKIFLLAGMLVIGLVVFPPLEVKANENPQVEQIQGLAITRITPARSMLGEKVWVVIQIKNTSNEALVFQFIERLGEAEFDKTEAKATMIFDPGSGMEAGSSTDQGFPVYSYEWKISLEPGYTTYLTYWLVPTFAGEYVISPARIILNEQTYKTGSRVIKVACQMDGVCQDGQGETVLSCPEDCKSGQADNICQAVLDGLIDPDCEDGYDPDAVQPTQTMQAVLPSDTPSATEGTVKFNPAICPTAALLLGLTLLFQVFRHSWGWLLHL